MYKISIPKSLLNEPILKSVCYSYVRKLSLPNTPTYISSSMLQYYMCNSDKNFKSEITECIEDLIKYGIITGESIGRNEWAVKLPINKEVFFQCYFEDIDQIMHSKYKYKLQIVKLYLNMMATINSKNHAAFTSVKNFSNKLGISEKTVSSYINILEKMKILFVARNRNSSSTYGHYLYKNNVIAVNMQRDVQHENLGANFRRRVSQQYNAYIKSLQSGKEWDDEKIIKLMYDVCLYNENIENSKDFSVFPDDILKLKEYNISKGGD